MVELLADLEKFLEEQRKKLDTDRIYINRATSTPLSLLRNANNTTLPGIGNQPRLSNLKSKSEDAFTQTEDLANSFLTSPKTDDSKLILSLTSMNKGLNESSSTEFPKYGLPGIGEYEEKHKLLVQEQKRELNKYLSNAIKEKENNKKRAPVNYTELLTQKRTEEEQYRGINDPEHLNSSFLPSLDLNNEIAFHKVRSPNVPINSAGKKEVDDLTGIQYTEMDDYDRSSFLRHSDPLPSIRSTNFRSADNIRSTIFPDLNGLSPRPHTLSSLDRSRELPPNPIVGVVPQANETNTRRPFDHSQEYRYQLEQQIQEQKARKKRVLEEERIMQPPEPSGIPLNNNRLSSQWDPWGKSGAGAPMRDLHGNLVTHRRGLNAMNAYNSSLPFYENSAHTLDGHRKVPETWHDNHWPLPEDKPSKPKLNYHDELRQQIDEKRRREQEERDSHRREEEQLGRRLERQREKIQAEYEAEQAKQKLREEEQRRKTERLLQIQELERKESQTKRHTHQETEWWERNTSRVELTEQEPSSQVLVENQGNKNIIEKTPSPMPQDLYPPIPSSPPITSDDGENIPPSTSPEPPKTTHSSSSLKFETERSNSPPIPTLRHQNKSHEKSSVSEASNEPITSSHSPVISLMTQSRKLSAVKSPSPLHRSPSPPIPALRRSSALTMKPTILISSPENSSSDTTTSTTTTTTTTPHTSPKNIPKITYRHPMISQEEILSLANSRVSSAASNQRKKKVEPKSSPRSSAHSDVHVLSQLSVMRRHLQLEQQRLQQLMKRDDRYEVFDPRVDNSRMKTSASWRSKREIVFPWCDESPIPKMHARKPLPPIVSRHNNTSHELEVPDFEGVDLDEIAARNRERKQNLEKLKRGDVNGTNNDADNVLEHFLKQQD